MPSHNFEQLKAHILPLSHSQDFNSARMEWIFDSAYITEEWDNCPCGQEIKEHCLISNRINGNKTYVGNVCVKRFMEIDTGSLFDGLKRIRTNAEANANLAVIEYAQDKGFLYNGEYDFLVRTKNKRQPSQKVKDWKAKISRRILKGIRVKQDI